MTKSAETIRSTSSASHGSGSFFDKKNAVEQSPSFFGVQTKLAIGKADDEMEQEADRVADMVQARLSVGSPDDPYEAEADRMADRVVSKGGQAVIQPKLEPIQRGREIEEGDTVFLKPATLQLLGEDIDGNGSRESIVAAAKSMIGKIQAKRADGGGRVGAKYLLDIFHLAAPGVWDDSTIQTAGAKLPSWCGIFSVWAHKRAGKDIGTWQIGKGVSAFGTIKQTTNPQPGDIGYIDQPFQHHCIIVKVDGNSVHSIDGNSGLFSEVIENIRPLSAYSGFFTAFQNGSTVQRKPKVQKKANGEGSTAPTSVEQSLASSQGKGDPLPDKVNRSMGSAMGADFSDVRIHDNHAAADMSNALNAQAFTHGKDIYFNRGKYDPESKSGQHLLAHELTHTVQQRGSTMKRMVQKSGDGGGSTTPATNPVVPDFKESAKEFHVEKINLPAFKKRNKEKFKLPLHGLSPRPEAWDHKEVWDKFVRKDVFNKTGSWLQDKAKTKHGEEDIYFLASSDGKFRLFGNMVTIQEAAINPKWDRFGKPAVHSVDHIVEVQLGGDNTEENFELMDAYANTNSGTAILHERNRQMEDARNKLIGKFPDIPKKKTLNANYITHFHKIDGWELNHLGSDRGEVFWKIGEIKDVKHLSKLRSMTKKEIEDSQGEVGKEFVLYMRKDGGVPIRIKLPFKPKKNWLPGIDLDGFDETAKTITFKVSTRLTKSLSQGKAFTVPFIDLPFLTNGGYLNFNTTTDKGLEGYLQFNGLSPLVITHFGLHETEGFLLTGNIITEIPIIDKTPISFKLNGEDFMVSKELELGNFENKFPKPFKITDVGLVIFASAQKGLGVEGDLNFEIEKVGKGNLKGLGSTQKGFGIEGSFDFDTDLFKSKIKASYIDRKFLFDGSVTLDKGKLPGVDQLTINVKYAEEKLSGTGNAKLSIPGVKEITIKVEQTEKGGLLIAGDVDFGGKFKSGGKVQAVFEKGDQAWAVSIKGELRPNIELPGFKIKSVNLGYEKGIFDLSAEAGFERGKVKGDFKVGVTNSNLSEEGKPIAGIGKELVFYASGEVGLDIVKGVEAKLKVRITKEGDIKIGGGVKVEEDKSIVDPKKGDRNTDKSLNIWDFSQKIPVASCGVVSLVLKLKAGIGLFYEFKGLTLQKGTNVTMDEISLKELNKAKLSSSIKLSTGAKAGVDAFIGAEAGLQVLIAGVAGTGDINLKLTAIDANATANVEAGFSADEGLQFKTANMEFDVSSSISYQISLGVRVYLDLLVTDVTLWSHKWEPESLKGEKVFSWFDGKIKVPIKFGEGNKVDTAEVASGLKKEIEGNAKDEKTFTDAAKQGVDGNGPDQAEEEQKIMDRIKESITKAYRGAHSDEVFAFNSSINEEYFNKRVAAWTRVNNLKKLSPEIIKLLRDEIINYEREEYDALVAYIQKDTYMGAGGKMLVIDDFIKFRPTLTAADKANVEALVPPDPKAKDAGKGKPGGNKKKPVQKKGMTTAEHGYAVPDDFAERMQVAKSNGIPLPFDLRAKMGASFGADFSAVRVHYDDEAATLASEVDAQAFTHEEHIFFNRGKYEPGSSEGQRLLAHELTHVVQQGYAETIRRVPEKDATGTAFTGNYIFDPGRNGLNSAFFNRVKRAVAAGILKDEELISLKKDAVARNGSVLHAELLLMAAMRNPLNVALMNAHKGGTLVLSMANILQRDRDHVMNVDRPSIPPDLEHPFLRQLLAILGLSGETLDQAIMQLDLAGRDYIYGIAGKQFADMADILIVSAGFEKPVIPLYEVVQAMINGAADSTPGDQLMAGCVYVVAKRYGHSTASKIMNGTIKVDAMIPSVFRRFNQSGEAAYSYSTVVDTDKANIIYLPTTIDIQTLGHRALIIHELTHAEDDLSRSTEQQVDSLALEERAYVAQGKYMMDEILVSSPAPGFVTSASRYVSSGNLYYWSMLMAAKANLTKYQASFIDVCTSSPSSKTLASVTADLTVSDTQISANIKSALLARRTPGGQPMYTAGTTTLGGGSGHFFQ